MVGSSKCKTRRGEIRRNRPEKPALRELLKNGGWAALAIAVGFFAVASTILLLREQVIEWRPDQAIPYDVVARVDFTYRDQDRLADKRREAADNAPRVYRSNGDVWARLKEQLLTVPDRITATGLTGLPEQARARLDSKDLNALRQYATGKNRDGFLKAVDDFTEALKARRDERGEAKYRLIILGDADRDFEKQAGIQTRTERQIITNPEGAVPIEWTYAPRSPELREVLVQAASKVFYRSSVLQNAVAEVTEAWLEPTDVVDDVATAQAKNDAAARVPSNAGDFGYKANMVLVPKAKGKFDQRDWQLLQAENHAYLASLGPAARWSYRGGVAGVVAIVTAILAGYVARFQPRIVENHFRGLAVAGLMLAMLLLAQLAGIGSGQLYLFAVGPAVMAAMVLTVAYDQRFAIAVGSLLGVLICVGLGQGIGFFVILMTGVVASSLMLDDIRNRGKLIEVGGGTAVAMIAAAAAQGAINMDPLRFVAFNCLYVGAAGLANGFVVFGILPFIEKAFRITTSMTLLELGDASHPLLRRLALEAPGTYSHSLQVATLTEAAAEAIGANSLLCRVASYYHDVGKINKADYFVENTSGGENRHLNLSPSVSLLVIIGHVKDGMELAREYGLPPSITPFIQQHHGTTLVEYFYHRARNQPDPHHAEGPNVSEAQYRYPGPRPRSKEVAILMVADAVESATRAMSEPTASRVEALCHDLIIKRLLDGQFDECDLTTRDLERIESAMTRTLLGIYHGRIAYPSTQAILNPRGGTQPATAARTA